MFWREHALPHFHALYGQHEALIDIRTLEIIGGSLPKRALSLTIEWAIEHRGELMEDWKLCQAKQQPNKVQPLKRFMPVVNILESLRWPRALPIYSDRSI